MLCVHTAVLQVYRGTWKHTEVAVKQFLPNAGYAGGGSAAAQGGVTASTAQVCMSDCMLVCCWLNTTAPLPPSHHSRHSHLYLQSMTS
jgi:hypothetical protein